MGSSSGPIMWTMNGCEVEETAGSKQELPINDQLVRKDNSQPATASSTSRMRTSRLHHPASIRLLSKVIQPALLRTRTDHLLNPPGFIQFSSNLASFHPPGIHSLVQQESSMSSPHLQNHLQSKQIHHPAPHFLNL